MVSLLQDESSRPRMKSTARQGVVMSRKLSRYFPSYRLCSMSPAYDSRGISFPHAGFFFATKLPYFGVTEAQKAALRWAAMNKLPPVCSVEHETPVPPDKDGFCDPNDLHRSFHAYATAVVTLHCLGEGTPRRIRIYFCNVELHEENANIRVHSRCKGTHIVPLAS